MACETVSWLFFINNNIGRKQMKDYFLKSFFSWGSISEHFGTLFHKIILMMDGQTLQCMEVLHSLNSDNIIFYPCTRALSCVTITKVTLYYQNMTIYSRRGLCRMCNGLSLCNTTLHPIPHEMHSSISLPFSSLPKHAQFPILRIITTIGNI